MEKQAVKNQIVKKERPVNLDLRTIQFPLTAVASIAHRISGVVIFIALALGLWLLGLSLSSKEGFMQASDIMKNFFVKFIFWGVLTALVYHIIGGIRHMLADFGCLEETQKIGTLTAKVAFAVTIFFSVLIGVALW